MSVCGAAPLLLRAFIGCGEKTALASVWRVFLRSYAGNWVTA
jgi:hypothetical protein